MSVPKPFTRKEIDKLTPRILTKWRTQGTFIRFLDGNVGNCAVTNLQWVSLPDAMTHVDDWKVDWDAELTPRERALVQRQVWRDGLTFA